MGVGLLIARGIARVLLKAYHVRTDDPSTTSRHFGAETKRSLWCALFIAHDNLNQSTPINDSWGALSGMELDYSIDTIGHAQGIGNKMIVLYTPCPFLWFLINFLRRKIVLWLFSDRCSDFSSSCCLL